MLRRGFDPYIVKVLMDELTSHGPHLHPNCTPKSISRDKAGKLTFVVSQKSGDEVRRCRAPPARAWGAGPR